MQLTAWLLVFLHSTTLTLGQDVQQPVGSVPSNDTLFWGPYRPNLYFGIRPRAPKSLLTSLLWANVNDFQSAQNNFRFTCEQHAGMAGYGWEEYDARHGGRQVIHDAGNKIDLTIDFVKLPGGTNGGSWATRIKGTAREDAPPNLVTTVIFQAGIEGLGELAFAEGESKQGFDGDIKIHGNTVELGAFDIDLVEDPRNVKPYKTHPSWDDKPLDRTLANSLLMPAEQMWRGLEIAFAGVRQTIEALVAEYGQENMPPPWQVFTIPNDAGPGNFHQIQKTFVGNFEFDVMYTSESGPDVSPAVLDKMIPSTSKSFKDQYNKFFKPQKPFAHADYEACGESMLSNLVGGIGYFYGDSLVDRSYDPVYDEEDEGFWEATEEARQRNQPSPDKSAELFTMVPSRPFFPRGFLWDEGFHLLPLAEFDVDLTLQILESWMNLMDSDGWIAREQILGPEARSKVPTEFQVQYPHYANPTTLFLVVESLLQKLESGMLSTPQKSDVTTRLAKIYPLLQRHYNWYRTTQAGDIKSYDREAPSTKEGYRWRGRTPRHILPSGLDDYPRAQPPHPGELHLDLLSWIGLMSRSLHSLSTYLSKQTDTAATVDGSDTSIYQKHLSNILANLDALHYSSDERVYCDATIDVYDEHALVCHKGYISLMPFMLSLLPPTHATIPDTLSLLSDPAHLWSPYGIRSLSRQDPLYATDENYWRSPIWINMNYLILRALHTLATSPLTPPTTAPKAAKIYNELRVNLVENVVRQWKDTGFAWEQYNPETGAGQRTQHFTGWTNLVVVIMAMEPLEGGSSSSGGSDGIVHGEL